MPTQCWKCMRQFTSFISIHLCSFYKSTPTYFWACVIVCMHMIWRCMMGFKLCTLYLKKLAELLELFHNRIAKAFCLWVFCLTLLWLQESCSHTLGTDIYVQTNVYVYDIHSATSTGMVFLQVRHWMRLMYPLIFLFIILSTKRVEQM